MYLIFRKLTILNAFLEFIKIAALIITILLLTFFVSTLSIIIWDFHMLIP